MKTCLYRNIRGIFVEWALFLAACLAIAGVVLIFAFMFNEGWPVIQKFDLYNLVLGKDWRPTDGIGQEWESILMLTKSIPAGEVKAFLKFFLSSQGQKIVAKDYIPIK